MMMNRTQQRLSIGLVSASLFSLLAAMPVPAQPPDTASATLLVDAAVKARIENIVGYSVTEHYAVYRNEDETHPVAEMTVLTTYKRDSGKSYQIVSQTGSEIVRSLVLGSILDNEKHLNQPGIREGAWITSANYDMKPVPGGTQLVDGRNCLVLALIPKRKAPFLIEGTLWVDSKDGSIVQVQGTASKSPSMLTGPAQFLRQYANVGGFPQAIHARAVSNSFMFGRTVIEIDYHDYHIQLRTPA